MNGRRFSLALLLALAGCAAVAQGAVAQVGTQAVNTTAVTCVASVEGFFEDSHCDKKLASPTGKFEHAAISKDTTTEIDAPIVGPWLITTALAGVKTEVSCSKAASVAGKSFIHNVESSGKHTATGTVQLNFTECTVIKPSKCVVKEPINLKATFEGVEKLEPTSKNEMGIEFDIETEEGLGLTFANKGAETCSLNNGGKPFQIHGSMIATGNTPTQKEKHSGATWKLETGTAANKMETLTTSSGTAVQIFATFTPQMASGGNPIAFTTVT
jgi:hypothetical protein